MLPRFAAIVCITMTGISSSSKAAILSTVMANGTKVISATSLVITMLEKKHNDTRMTATCLLPFAFTAASAFYAEPIADGIAALTSTTAFAIVYMKYLKGTGSLMEIGTGRGQAA